MFERGKVEPLYFDKNTKRSCSVTQQQFKKDADINNIMAKYQKTGVLVNPLDVDSSRVPQFGDFTKVGDLSEMINIVRSAQEGFMTLPAATRAKFDNDVTKAVDFMCDPANIDECFNLGLLPESERPKPVFKPAEGAAVQPPPAGQQPAV